MSQLSNGPGRTGGPCSPGWTTAQVDAVIERLAQARRIVVFGGGRERLQIMGFAMRLFHMGLQAAVEGDMTTPAVGPGDVFLVTCGPGYISTAQALMAVAQGRRGRGDPVHHRAAQGPLSPLADLILHLPAQTMADDQGDRKSSVLPMGSLFEGALVRAVRGDGAEAEGAAEHHCR